MNAQNNGNENVVSKTTNSEKEEENSNWRFYLLCAVTLVFTIGLIVDQYITNHH